MFKIGDEVEVINGSEYIWTKDGSQGIIVNIFSEEQNEVAVVHFTKLTCNNTEQGLTRNKKQWIWDLDTKNLKLIKTRLNVGDRVEEIKTGDIGTVIKIDLDMWKKNSVYYIKWDKDGHIFYLEDTDIIKLETKNGKRRQKKVCATM